MDDHEHVFDDRTPGVEEHEPTASYLSYTVGLGLAIAATIASFIVSQTNLLFHRAIILNGSLLVAQMAYAAWMVPC